MPNTTVYTNNQYYQDIADAIRLKNGSSNTYTPAQMAGAINALNVSGTLTLRDAIVTPTEDEQVVTPGTGYVGLSSVTINPIDSTYIGSSVARRTLSDVTAAGASVIIPVGYYALELTKSVVTANHQNPIINVDSETGLITASHTQSAGYVNAGTTTATSQLTTQAAVTITPNTTAQTAVTAGKYTLGPVTVAAIQTEEKTTTVNGEITPSSGKYLTKVTVNVPVGSTINNQNKTVTPTEERQYTTPDTGYTGLSQVIVEPISSTYVGSGITTRTSTDLTASGATVTVPAGYYSDNSSKAVTTAVQATPTISVNTSTGEITATSAQSAGYVAAGTQTATEQLSIQAAATITPNNTSQTAVAANKYTTGTITVAAVPTETKSITANGTYTPATGKYFSSVTVDVPTVNISQDQNGYIVMDDDGNYGGNEEKLPLDSLAKKLNGELTVYHSNSVKTIGHGGLRDAGTITHLVLPNLETIAATAYLLAIRSLTAVDFGPVDNIRQQLFYNDSNLTTIVLRKNTVVPVNGTAFQGTPFASGGTGGEIYIPKVLYDHLGDGTASDYKATTNWSTFDGYGTITWKQIEGSQYENYYVDGTLVGSDDGYGEKITGDTYADHSYPQGAIEVTVTNLLQHTFRERTGITSFSAPNCTTMGGYQFYHCTALERISFPNLTGISTSNAFDGCTALVGVVFPAMSGVPNMNSAFLNCTSLAYADFGSGLNYLNGSNMFRNCSNLKTVIIRKTSAVSQLTALNHFDGSPFASDGTGGTLYVPSALISSYQSATNWSTILGYANNQILAIEGSIYETQYADGTPIE